MDPVFGSNNGKRKKADLSPGERLRNAEFRRKKENDEGACLFCDHDKLDDDGVRRCSKLRITFWDDFSAGEYVCDRYNGSEFDSIIDDLIDLDQGE